MTSEASIAERELRLAEIARGAGEAFAWTPEEAPARALSLAPLAWLAAGCAAAALYAVL